MTEQKGALKLTQKNVDYINAVWKDFQEAKKREMHVAIEKTPVDKEWKVVELR